MNVEVAFTYNIQHWKFSIRYYFYNRFYYLGDQLYDENIFKSCKLSLDSIAAGDICFFLQKKPGEYEQAPYPNTAGNKTWHYYTHLYLGMVGRI